MSRHRVSLEQIYTVIEFLETHPEMVKVQIRSREGLSISAKLWKKLTKKTNGVGGGCHKTAKEWQKYITDYKSRVMYRVEKNRLYGEGEGGWKLSPCEQRLANLIGKYQPGKRYSSYSNTLVNQDSAEDGNAVDSSDWTDNDEEESRAEAIRNEVRRNQRKADVLQMQTNAWMRLTNAINGLATTLERHARNMREEY